LIEEQTQKQGIPTRFAATKFIEGDEPMLNDLSLTDSEIDAIEHAVKELETELKTDREAALADIRYQFVEDLCKKSVVKTDESREYIKSVWIDTVLTHKFLAIPTF